jgi:hypothetical protein
MGQDTETFTNILPHLQVDLIRTAYQGAAGRELETKFLSPESSAALAANAFGPFLGDGAHLLPALPGLAEDFPATQVRLEARMPFPWRGGRTPWLDALVTTRTALIGIESKRYEPFRGKAAPHFSKTYGRDLFGNRMTGFHAVRTALTTGSLVYRTLDAAQLVKHAYGLRTAVHGSAPGLRPHLVYLHAEPMAWVDGTPIAVDLLDCHRQEVADFAARVAGDEVGFSAMSYQDLLASWQGISALEHHRQALRDHFRLGP